MGKILPFGEWLPDMPAFGNPGTVNVLNVIPLTQGSYGPFKAPQPYAAPLSAAVQGAYTYRDPTGVVYNFVGTATDLYLQATGATDFANVSKTAGVYTTDQAFDGFWQFTSFGSLVLATNYNDPIQQYAPGSGAAGTFTDLTPVGGSSPLAPQAQYIAVIKDFVMVGNLYDPVDGPVPYRLRWCALGDPTSWPTPGTNAAIEVQSDFQDLVQTDLGEINGLVGGHLSSADAAIICERGIYRAQYVGSPDIFTFAVAQGAAGTDAPLSIVNRTLVQPGGLASSVIYYLGSDGFYLFDGGSSISIGAQKVDRTFFNDLDIRFIRAVQGTYDPQFKLIFWFYHGSQNNGLYNKCLVYNWELGRWAPADLTATPIEWAGGVTYSPQGYTLDELDQFGPLDSLPYSLDSREWTQGNPVLSWFTANHQQAFASGDSLQATVETTEAQLFPGLRSRITSTRPIADGALSPTISVGQREQISQPVVYTVGVPVNIIGDCPQRTTGRYQRFQMIMPPAANFNHLQGIDVSASPEGIR